MSDINYDFHGKNIVVAGASSGIGRQVALELAEAGAKVLVIARREHLLLELSGQYGNITPAKADVCNYDELENGIAAFVKQNGKIHGAVYVAGKTGLSLLRKYDEAEAREIMDINFWAGTKFMQICSRRKYSQDGASLVWLSSIGAEYAFQGLFAYSCSKAAVETAVRTFAKELSVRKLRINALRLGIVDTPMTDNEEGMERASIENYIRSTPFGQAKPVDISGNILFLLSERSSWQTGSVITLHGGFGV